MNYKRAPIKAQAMVRDDGKDTSDNLTYKARYLALSALFPNLCPLKY